MQEGGANEKESAAIEEKEAAAVLPPPPAAAEAAAEATPPLPPPPPAAEAPPLPVETAEAAPEAATAAAAEAPEAETEAAVAAEAAEEDSVTSEQSEAATMVKIVGDLTEFRSELSDAGDKLIVVDFSATWCGPCKMIKPFFHSMVEKYPDVVFIEIDVDDAQDVASHCDVKCMPTFQFYKNNEKVHEFSGANKEKLEEAIKKYM
ncbi:thioredoxin [Protobothrops mucrosquamatus]|uniref:thioredoxin n=1 Tax=Protobothrops mucrosquamatus TaxID=103944 RepID=UPI000775C46B|nr:thioredoxin [Protobothrops mucrosquamatus]